jgi:hypothetical protein
MLGAGGSTLALGYVLRGAFRRLAPGIQLVDHDGMGVDGIDMSQAIVPGSI